MENSEMIRLISSNGDRYGSELERFCQRYGLMGLMDATDEQLAEYIRDEGIIQDDNS